MERKNTTTQELLNEFHKRLVKTCIDFINEKGLKDVWRVEFNADDLQASADYGDWHPATDSYLELQGLEYDKKTKLSKTYEIGESF